MKLINLKQILTLNNLPLRGKISDKQLEIIENSGILINSENKIEEIETMKSLQTKQKQSLSNSPTLNFQLCSFTSFHELSHSYLFWRK